VKTHLLIVAMLLPAAGAFAQVGETGLMAPNLQPAPVNLDPAENNPLTGPAPQAVPQPQAPAQPNIVVVGPDGKVSTPGLGSAAPSGYYVAGGDFETNLDQGEIHSGATPEFHVVRTGDTLWGICGIYFNDPWQWPKVWSYNAQITNPHWIYPGDLVRLLPRGVFATKPDATKPTENKPPDQVPPPQNKLEVGLRQVAFVEQGDIDKSIMIDGAVDEKTLLGDGDSVYLSYPSDKPPQVGQRYSIYKPGNTVKSNGSVVGSYVQIYGTVEVVSVKQDKRARGVILEANHEIERGLKVGPLVKTYKTVEPKAPEVDAQGQIVAMLTSDQLLGQGELVMVDLGKNSGVEVGNRMFVVRRGDALPPNMDVPVGQDDRRFPARALGEVVIVQVGERISVALVTLAVQEMGVGDIVMMQKAGS
jgi:hypothetical protein